MDNTETKTPEQMLEDWLSDHTDSDNEYVGDPADEEEYKRMLLHGVSSELLTAMEIYAYACYTGTKLFPQDFTKSRDCLLRLLELSDGPQAADWCNTLGYIYWYGRTNHGEPQYDLALRYFTVAAQAGIYEAQYKIADMMIQGIALPKNPLLGAGVLDRLYGENREHIELEHFGCKFADIALRLGRIYQEGIGFEKDPENALSLYLQADFAIKKRREFYDYYGDASVEKRIAEALQNAKDNMPSDYFKDRLEFDNPALVGVLLRESNGIDVCLLKKDEELYIVAKRVPMDDRDERKYLFCLPELDICVLADSVVMKVEGIT